MGEEELSKILKEDVNEIISDEENTKVIEDEILKAEQEFDKMTFEDIEKYLSNEENIIAVYRSYNKAILFVDKRDKKEKLYPDRVTDEEILKRFNRDNTIERKRIEILLKKVTNLIEEKRKIVNNNISTFELTEEDFEEIEKYNEKTTSLSEFYQKTGVSYYKKYDIINVENIKKDIANFDEFCKNINDINYDNVGQKSDAIYEFSKKYSKNKYVIEALHIVFDKSKHILAEKESELSDLQKNLNTNRKESTIFDESIDNKDFISKMMEQDKEAISKRENLNTIKNEIIYLEQELSKYELDSDEYTEIKNKLNQINTEYSKINKEISNKEKEYQKRYEKLHEFDKKYGKEIEKYNKLREKKENIRKKYISLVTENRPQNKDTIENNSFKEEEQDELIQDIEENSKLENNTLGTMELNNLNTNISQDINTNNIHNEQTHNTEIKPQSSNEKNTTSNNELTILNSQKLIDTFCKMNDEERKLYLKDNGYYKLSETINSNKDKINLSKKQRNEIKASLDFEIKNSLKKEIVKNRLDDIAKFISKFTEEYPDINTEFLVKKLFLYDDNGIPFIACDKILSDDIESLAFIISSYNSEFKYNKLDISEIEEFEKYILNPINVSIIKENMENMSLKNRILNKFSKSTSEYRLVKSALKKLNETKEQIKSGKNTSNKDNMLGGYVYTSEEQLANIINELDKEMDEQKSKSVQTKDNGEII